MNDILDNMGTIRGREVISSNRDKTLNNLVTLRGVVEDGVPTVDQFELGVKLGEGGFGAVYLAHDTVGGRKVALKVLPPLLASDSVELNNVRHNFKLVSALHHQHIASLLHLHQIRDVSRAAKELLKVDSGGFLVVMEYVEGVTLSRWRKDYEGFKVPFASAILVCKQVALALDFAHKEKIIHRDIKPSNIMVTGGMTKSAKVLDFGLAAEIRASLSRVSLKGGNTSGTRPYMAPEQWLGKNQGAATDQYALAVLFYELVGGVVPFYSVFETNDTMLMLNVVETRQPEPLSSLSASQNQALMKGLAKSPTERYDSCTDLIEAIERGKVGRTAKARFVKWAASILLLLILACVALFSHKREPISSPHGTAVTPEAVVVSQEGETYSPEANDDESMVVVETEEEPKVPTNVVAKEEPKTPKKELRKIVSKTPRPNVTPERNKPPIDSTKVDRVMQDKIRQLENEKLKLDLKNAALARQLAKEKKRQPVVKVTGATQTNTIKVGTNTISGRSESRQGDSQKIKLEEFFPKKKEVLKEVPTSKTKTNKPVQTLTHEAALKLYLKNFSRSKALFENYKIEQDPVTQRELLESALQKALEVPLNLIASFNQRTLDKHIDDVSRTYRSKFSFALIHPTVKMISVAPGRFTMGSLRHEKGHDADENRHEVILEKGFWMSETEVTQTMYQQVTNENPSSFRGGALPVENLSWNQAKVFCQKLTAQEAKKGTLPKGFSYRLPTEAEWEYCCRAGTQTTFCFGNQESLLPTYAWYTDNSKGTTHPVRQKKPNNWGFYDMHGNVWEWCLDAANWSTSYGVISQTYGSLQCNPLNKTGSAQILRGGGRAYYAEDCRSADRICKPPNSPSAHFGFRIVLARPVR